MIYQIKIIKCIDNISNNHKEKLNTLSFKERQLCLSMNSCLSTMPIYESKNCAHSETFFNRLKSYTPFVLMDTMCKKVDYWFEKRRIRGPIFNLNYRHNCQKIDTLKDINPSNE
jgi:hypothetical protein